MKRTHYNLGGWLAQGFALYRRHFGLLLLASLMATTLAFISVGVLLGPMLAGMILVCLALCDRQEPPPDAADLFAGLRHFGQAFLFVLYWGVVLAALAFVLGFIPCLGTLASGFLICAASALLMFAPFLIVDRGMDFWTASLISMRTVKAHFWPFWGLFIVTALLAGLGSVLCAFGVFLTAPLYFCVMTVAYRAVFPKTRAAAELMADIQALRRELEEIRQARRRSEAQQQ